jgi:hypothetical protein
MRYYKKFKPNLINDFIDNVKNEELPFINLYKNKNKFEFDFNETDIEESNIAITTENVGKELLEIYQTYKSETQKADFECAKFLYENIELTPNQASNANFWNYLHHFDMYKYIQERWKSQGNLSTHIKRHWLLNLTSQKHLINYPLTTLWWSIHLTINKENIDNPYNYTKIYFSNNRFRTASLGGVSFVRHQDAIFAVLEFLNTHRTRLTKDITYTKLGDDISKFINLLGGTKPLTFFNKKWFIEQLEKKYSLTDSDDTIEDETVINNEVLCYFCLNNTDNPNYLISNEKQNNFDYCIEINTLNRNGYLVYFYEEGKIKKTKINSGILEKTREIFFSNGKCNRLNLLGLKIINSTVLFGISYVLNGVTYFKAMDEGDSSVFRDDNDSFHQEGKKILYVNNYSNLKFKVLPYSLKEGLGTLVQTPLGKGANIKNNYHSEKWKLLKKHWIELFEGETISLF